MSTYTTRHDDEEIDDLTEESSAQLDVIPSRIVPRDSDDYGFPQVITPTAIRPGGYAQHPHQILDPAQIARMMGAPTRTPPRWLVGVKDLFGHAADNHILPAAGVLTMAGVSVWAHTQPYHPLIGGSIIAVGAYLVRAGIKAHRHHGADADAVFTKGLLGSGALLALTGTGAAAGVSPWTAVAATLGLGFAYAGWHQWNHHKLERAREFTVALTAAGNTGPMPPGTGGRPALGSVSWAPGTLPLSDEEFRLSAALAKTNAAGAILSPVRRVNDDVWYVFADLAETDATAEQIENQATKIATRMRARRVEIEPGNRPSLIKITVHDGDDPLDRDLPWPGPRIASILEPVPLGQFEDGTEATLSMAWGHTLVAGTTDGGKSGVVNAILLGTLGCTDLVRILTDCKAGAPEFRAYKDIAFNVASGPEEGMRTLAGLKAVYEYRGNLLVEKDVPAELDEGGETVRKWKPEYGPFILAAIDELAELTKNVKGSAKTVQSLRATMRFVGMFALDATQNPSRSVFDDSTDARLNYRNRIGLQTMETTATNIILGPRMHGQGWRLDLLDLPGKMMIYSREHRRPRVARAYLVTDRDMAQVIAQYRGKVAELDEGSAEAFWEGYHAYGQSEEDETGGGGGGPRGGRRPEPQDAVPTHAKRGLYLVPTYPDGTEIDVKFQALWRLLGEFGAAGATRNQLAARAEALGHRHNSPSWVGGRLKFWREKGYIGERKEGAEMVHWRTDLRSEREDADGAAS